MKTGYLNAVEAVTNTNQSDVDSTFQVLVGSNNSVCASLFLKGSENISNAFRYDVA